MCQECIHITLGRIKQENIELKRSNENLRVRVENLSKKNEWQANTPLDLVAGNRSLKEQNERLVKMNRHQADVIAEYQEMVGGSDVVEQFNDASPVARIR